MNDSEEDSWYKRDIIARESTTRALLRIARCLEKIVEGNMKPLTEAASNETDKQAQPA